MNLVTYQEFEKIDIRSGTILKAEPFPKARNPSYKVWVDFGPFGVKQTSAQITVNYQPEQLIGKQVIGVLNLGQKNIAGFVSEFLLLGLEDEQNAICLLTVDKPVPNGKKMF